MDELPRGIEGTLAAAMGAHPVVVLEGLRAVGKSTLVRRLVAPGLVRDLADPAERQRALADVVGWVEALPEGAAIDEAQLVPNLQLAIKRFVDERHGRPGQFVLTGSARLRTDELGGSAPLAGRDRRLRLHPFAQCERTGRPVDVVAALFDEDPREWSVTSTASDDLVARMTAGGLPTMWDLGRRAHADALDSFTAGLFDAIYPTARDRSALVRFFRWLCGSSGELRNIAEFSQKAELARVTVDAYIEVLRDVHLVEQVPSFRHGAADRETDRPRLFVADASFAASALPGELDLGAPEAGRVFETFVAMEMLRLVSWASMRVALHHWRARQRHEVDLVLERDDGRIVGIEVKSTRSSSDRHFGGLRALREAYPERFHRGFVVHRGDHPLRYEDDLWAIPVSSLWEIGAPVSHPTTGAVDFRDRVRSAVEQARTTIGLMSGDEADRRRAALRAALEHGIERLNQLADVLRTLDLDAVVTSNPESPGQGPVRNGEVTWSASANVRVTNHARGRVGNVVLRGQQVAGGDVDWTVFIESHGRSLGGDAETVPWDGDHRRAINGLLDRVPPALTDFISALF